MRMYCKKIVMVFIIPGNTVDFELSGWLVVVSALVCENRNRIINLIF